MMSPSDPFALNFDSIPVEPRRRRGDATAAFGAEHAAPTLEAPGFYLIDDCNGRFSVDRETGVVSLQHEHLLSIEGGAIHPVHLRVIEKSGGHYDLKLRLRMTCRVPQIAGAEENDALAGLAAAPLRDIVTPEQKGIQHVPTSPPQPWVTFSAVAMHLGKHPLYGESAPFGSLFETPAAFPDVYIEPGKLRLEMAPPSPAPANAAWAI